MSEFKCPKCSHINNQERDKNLTDGQESEWMSGFRLCSKCNWYGQPDEIMMILAESDEDNFFNNATNNQLAKKINITKMSIRHNYKKCPKCKNNFKFNDEGGIATCNCGDYNLNEFAALILTRENNLIRKNNTNIYMAGKIDKNDWRHSIVNNLRNHSYWEIDKKWDMTKYNQWRYLKFSDNLVYTGPFFLSCDHGCSHGSSTHGVGENVCIEDIPTKEDVFKHCIKQISDSDYVFCWIDSLDCYGTLFELGVAHQQGKKIFIGLGENLKQVCDCNTDIDDAMIHTGKCWGCHSPIKNTDDLWFIKQSGESNYYNNHMDAWNAFLDWGPMKVEEKVKEEFVKTLNTQELEDYEDIKNKQPMSKTINYFKRNRKIVDKLKKLYDGKCQICESTFEKADGSNYCETHHVKALGKNGTDTIDNLVVLCPTCHKKLHFAKEKEFDIKYKEEHYKLMEEQNEAS